VDNRIVTSPLKNLSYFVEWGGKEWERLLRYAIREFVGTNLEGQHILDIGTRYGKMASLFALLGGTVTGIDIREDCLTVAKAEARNWGVSDRINFIAYDGELDIFPDKTFDMVFTKSVLVIVPRLGDFLRKIEIKLKPQGKIVFLENGRGGNILHALRAIRHRDWDYTKANYFTDRELTLISNIFEVKTIKKTLLPPIYLILGFRKQI
jgi:ubiquinone/menaquinone biosynthesis C-methylase UbiE